MGIYEVKGKRPRIAPTTFVCPEAVVIGDVEIGRDCFVAPGAVIRGDFGSIRIGDESNIQDNAVVHSRPEAVTSIGSRVSIAHGAIIHCCTIEDDALIGMRAVVSDWVVVGKGAIVAEGAVVTHSTSVEPNSVVAGIPAKPVKTLKRKDYEYVLGTKMLYVQNARHYIRSFKPLPHHSPVLPARQLVPQDGCVLVVVDMQEKLFPVMQQKERLLKNVLRLVRFARTADIPIVLTEQYPKGLGRTIKEVAQALPPNIDVIEKVSFGCFGEPKFLQKLETLNAKTLVVCGIEAHICVGQTVLATPPHLTVLLVTDAVSSYSRTDTETAIERAKLAGAIPVTTEMFMFEFLKTAKTELFERCLDILRRD